jgi:hypothetical protein
MPIFDTLVELSKYYINTNTNEQAKIMIERNRGFYLLKKFEENNLNYLLLPNIRYIKKTDSYEFDLDENGNPFKLGFVTSDSKRKKMLITLANFMYKNNELPKDLVEEAHKFVYKGHGKPVGLEHDDLLFSTAIGLFTDEILSIAKNNKGNKNLQKFIKAYWNSQVVKHSYKAATHEEKIDEQINNIVLRNHLILNDNDLTGLNLQMMEACTEKEGSGKLRAATNALLYCG